MREETELNVYTLFVRNLEIAAWLEVGKITVFAQVGENYDIN